MALSDNALPIDAPRLMAAEKLAIVLGTEGDGLAAATIARCDYTACIPMSHGVDSLNVAAASAVRLLAAAGPSGWLPLTSPALFLRPAAPCGRAFVVLPRLMRPLHQAGIR